MKLLQGKGTMFLLVLEDELENTVRATIIRHHIGIVSVKLWGMLKHIHIYIFTHVCLWIQSINIYLYIYMYTQVRVQP